MIDLTSYKSIHSALAVRIQVDNYRTTPSGSYSQEFLRFSDFTSPLTINSEEYIGVGRLMGITSSSSELRVSSGELTITLSGIPDARIAEIVNSKIKGCPVSIYRVLLNPADYTVLNIVGNPMGRFRGFVNNYSLQEEYDAGQRTGRNTIVLICASAVDVLSNKVAGRKTNPASQKRFYPSDVSMDRVPTLENTTFDFGAPK